MSDDVRWFDALDASELWEGDLIDVDVSGEDVMIAHLDGGEIKAFQGMCPHQEISLADGKWDSDSGVLVCNGHNWEFDMRTGQGLNPSGCRLFEYAVRVTDDGKVQVAVPQDGERHYMRYPAN